MTYSIAKNYLENGNTSGKYFFKDNAYMLEYGYCLILENKLDSALKILNNVKSLRAEWAVDFIPFLQGYVEKIPAYLQIRNFLEIDINLLFLAKQRESIINILSGADMLFSSNCETYKYIARVLMNNGYMDISKQFIDKGIAATYNDPELQFMNCQYYIYLKDFPKAILAIEECLKILPEYYPAKMMLADLLKK